MSVQRERIAELTSASAGSAAGTEAERRLWDIARWTAAVEQAERQRDCAVAAARAEGASWGRIGAALGVSRQAACKKYGAGE